MAKNRKKNTKGKKGGKKKNSTYIAPSSSIEQLDIIDTMESAESFESADSSDTQNDASLDTAPVAEVADKAADLTASTENTADLTNSIDNAADVTDSTDNVADLTGSTDNAADLTDSTDNVADLTGSTDNAADLIDSTDNAADLTDSTESCTPEGNDKQINAPLPEELASSLHLMTDHQKELAIALCSPPSNQSHIFKEWPVSTGDKDADEKKKALIQQLERMDKSYPNGGLVAYIQNSKILLEQSRKGVNPLEGWKPSVPDGKMFDLGTEEYKKYEEKGIKEMGKCAFVLVAGGLGERLGYNGVKLALPSELATETLYLQLYIETIIAIQSKYAAPDVKLSLCIMVSNDTNAKTLSLLKEHDNFGLDDEQITIVEQGEGVPALIDNNATIAMDDSDKYKIQAKPHGHGDIHALLHSNGVVKKWRDGGLEWVIFCQDTNGLAFHTLPLALGVSKELNLVMNSIAVPRKAKQAIGAIAKLTNTIGEQRTINVEYNQLDPLLRASGFPDGDVNDKSSGFSPFPGNINQLLFQLQPYSEALDRTNGAMPEFVNPKYADAEKTIFKKPTRLECMMQEFPATLEGDVVKQIGFTSVASDLCFSPVKNAIKDGIVLQQKGTHPGVAASGEADQYAAFRTILSSIGCKIENSNPVTFSGIKIIPGPEIVLKPNFVLCPADCKAKFPQPERVKISKRSSLVVNGSGIVIESLDLDGALVIECENGAAGTIRDLVVKNKGWEKVADESLSSKEYIRMRGYHLKKIETQRIIFRKDGSIEGLPLPSVAAENGDLKSALTEKSPKFKSRQLDLSTPSVVDAETKSSADGECCAGCQIM